MIKLPKTAYVLVFEDSYYDNGFNYCIVALTKKHLQEYKKSRKIKGQIIKITFGVK